jgi:predicted transcriptional regulator
VLSIIDTKNDGRISKKELIEELQKLGLIPMYPVPQPRNAPHNRLRAILEPLETHWQFIQIKSRGRRSEVSLTEQGKTVI